MSSTTMKHAFYRILTFVFILVFAFSHSEVFATTTYQKCEKGSSCEVGEFLYDDFYVPIATASCTLTSRYPDGNLFVNSAPMDSQTDGWYSYTIEATGSAGLYRSQICCTATTEYLCLDKSFVVEIASSSASLTQQEIADAVWDEQRSLHTNSGSFGEALQNVVPTTDSISQAVWDYSSRNLTGFGSLISDLWGFSTRTVSTTLDPNSAKKSDVDAIKKEVIYNQSLLEKLANKPMISNFLEEEADTNLDAKLNETQFILLTLMIDSYAMDTKLQMVDEQWVEIKNEDLLSTIQEVSALNDSISTTSKKINELWNLEVADSINSHAENFKNRITVIQSELTVDEKSKIGLEDIRSLDLSLNNMIKILGNPNSKSGDKTLFGEIQTKKELADTLDSYTAEADGLLANWEKTKFNDKQRQINTIATKISSINKLPRSSQFATIPNTDDLDKKMINQVFTLKGTIAANKIFLAKKTATPFSSSWLELGSVVFKTMLTNPSTKISQDVPLKYYLPQEISMENIIELDEGIAVNFDVEKKQLYVEGEFTLEPSESKVVSVRVEDIWIIDQSKIDSLRTQTEEMVKPLANTSFYGQGVTIKSSINVSLDKIMLNQKTSITPEAKIKNFYEAQIELNAIDEQLINLQNLVTQSGSVGSLAGFVGGAQAIAVWGLIIIMVTGFVFLVIYMRTLKNKELNLSSVEYSNKPKSLPASKPIKQKTKKKQPPSASIQQHQHLGRYQMIKLAALFIALTSVSTAVTGITIRKTVSKIQEVQNITEQPNTPTEVATAVSVATESGSVMGVSQEKRLTIKQTPTGWLNVRNKPSSKSDIIAKVYPKESYPYIEVVNGWYKIKTTELTEGWISNVYIQLDDQE